MEFTPQALILEDEKLKYDLRESLKRGGFNTRLARSVNNFIALARTGKYDASVIDIRLTKGGTEGLEAISRVREINPTMYIEVLTAYKEFEQQALELGADNVSFKPTGARGLSPRIKCGIIKKNLSAICDNLGIDNSTVDCVDLTESDYQFSWAILNEDILTNCILDINYFLDTFASNLEFEPKDFERAKRDIGNIIINRFVNNSRLKKKESDKVLDPAHPQNNNYLAFVKHRSELEKKYNGLYIAIVNGNFFGANYDLLELHRQLDKKHAQEDAFIKRISKKEKVISLKRPRKIIRN